MVKPYQRIVSLVCIACETCECERCNVEDLAKRIIDDVRADAIDEFAQAFKDYVYTEKLRGNEPYWIVAIKKVSEKLKEQNNDNEKNTR